MACPLAPGAVVTIRVVPGPPPFPPVPSAPRESRGFQDGSIMSKRSLPAPQSEQRSWRLALPDGRGRRGLFPVGRSSRGGRAQHLSPTPARSFSADTSRVLTLYLVFPDTWHFAHLSDVSPSVLASEPINSPRLRGDSSFWIPFPRLNASSARLLNKEEHRPRKGSFCYSSNDVVAVLQMWLLTRVQGECSQ